MYYTIYFIAYLFNFNVFGAFFSLKGATTTLSVVCKSIAFSIENHLLYLPTKYQG